MEAFLCAIVTEPDRTPAPTRRSLFISIVLLSLFSSWWQASAFLSEFGRVPLDGTPESARATLAFGAIGLVVGLSVGHAFVLSRNLFVRTALSGVSSAVFVALLIDLVGVDAFSLSPPMPDPDALLNTPIAWGLALGAPLGASAALQVHLLRRTMGKLRLTLIVCLVSALIGIQSERVFWKHWDYRSFSGWPGCFPHETEGWLVGMVGAIALCFGILALDLAARLRAPGAARDLLRRLRSDFRKGGPT